MPKNALQGNGWAPKPGVFPLENPEGIQRESRRNPPAHPNTEPGPGGCSSPAAPWNFRVLVVPTHLGMAPPRGGDGAETAANSRRRREEAGNGGGIRDFSSCFLLPGIPWKQEWGSGRWKILMEDHGAVGSSRSWHRDKNPSLGMIHQEKSSRMWELPETALFIPAGILCRHRMFSLGIWAPSCKSSQSHNEVFQGKGRISLADPTCAPFPEAQGWDHPTITGISPSQELCLTSCGHLQLPQIQSHCSSSNFHGFNPTAPPPTPAGQVATFSTWNCFIRKRSINNKPPPEEELLEGREILEAKQIPT